VAGFGLEAVKIVRNGCAQCLEFAATISHEMSRSSCTVVVAVRCEHTRPGCVQANGFGSVSNGLCKNLHTACIDHGNEVIAFLYVMPIEAILLYQQVQSIDGNQSAIDGQHERLGEGCAYAQTGIRAWAIDDGDTIEVGEFTSSPLH